MNLIETYIHTEMNAVLAGRHFLTLSFKWPSQLHTVMYLLTDYEWQHNSLLLK